MVHTKRLFMIVWQELWVQQPAVWIENYGFSGDSRGVSEVFFSPAKLVPPQGRGAGIHVFGMGSIWRARHQGLEYPDSSS